MSTDDTKKVPDLGTLSAGEPSGDYTDSDDIDADFSDEEESSHTSFDDMIDDDGAKKKGGMGKLALPALALSVATIVGTVIVFGPQLLGKPSAQADMSMSSVETPMPTPAEAAPLLPEPVPTDMAAAGAPPQPPAAINEPTPPAVSADVPPVTDTLPPPDQAAAVENTPSVPVVEPTVPDAPNAFEDKPAETPVVPTLEEKPVDVAAEQSASAMDVKPEDAPAEAKIEEVPLAPVVPETKIADASATENKDMFAGVPTEAKVDIATTPAVTPSATTPNEPAATLPPAEVAPPPAEDLPQPPAAVPSGMPSDTATAPLIPDFEVKGDANAPVKPDAHAAKIPDVYYDGINVPSGSMAKAVGPRKMDPTQEPASKFVIVEKTHNANDHESQVTAASRALKLGRYDAAVEMYQRLHEKNPRDPRILMGLAVSQQNSGMAEAAIQSYQKFLDIKPNDTDATVNMLGLVRQQYPAVALRRLKELSDKYPTNAGIAAQIGITEGQEGNYDSALRYLGIASGMQPQNALHLFNMAIIAEKKGDKAKAINYYEQALEVDAVYGGGASVPRDKIYSRLSRLRG
mgnify:CR=1 FL=1